MTCEEVLKNIETPCVVIDEKKTIENIKSWQKFASDNGCVLRPHVKTHKMPYFSRMQIEHGAQGITCCKITEAEVMADGGIDDIFIAYPIIGNFRFKRAKKLLKKVKRLILAVDSLEGAQMLNDYASENKVEFEIRMEVDTGADRTGVRYETAVETAVKINKLSHLNLTGIYTFKHLYYKGEPTTDKYLAGKEEGEMMQNLAEKIRNAGVDIKDVSAGSSPTAQTLAEGKWVSEIRPGTYIFKDYMMVKEEVAQVEDIAAHIYVTVVSTPTDGYAVIDAGNKAISKDILLDSPPYFYPAYALVEGNDDLVLTRSFEEHGMIFSKSGKTNLKVGQILKLIPIHVCAAINAQNEVYIYDGENLWSEKVAGRGMFV